MSARQVELVIRRGGHPERRMALSPGSVVIGRAEDNDVVLSEIGVSRRHARIVVEEDAVLVEDMGSGNGTWFRGARVERQVLDDGDEVVIDPFVLAFHVHGSESTAEVTAGRDATVRMGGLPAATGRLEIASPHPTSRRAYEIPSNGSLSIGRSEKADVVLPEPVASRLHCDVGETAGTWWVRDRESANGTYVNGVRIRERMLADGDRIRIGSVEIRFVAPPSVAPEDSADHTEAFDDVMFTAALAEPGPSAPNLAAPAVPGPPAGFGATPTLIREAPGPPPPRPAPPVAGPAPTRPLPPGPAPRLGGKPRPAPLPAPAAPASTPGVEIDFDVDKVKARKGPTTRRAARDKGFLSRPINQVSIGLLLFTGLLVGGRMVWDLGRALVGPTSRAETAATAPAPPPPAPSLASATPGAALPASSGASGTVSALAAPSPASGPGAVAHSAPSPVSATEGAAAAGAPATDPPVAATGPGSAEEPPSTLARPGAASPALPAVPRVAPSARVPLDPPKREEVAALMAEGMRLFTEGRPFEAAAQFYKVQQVDPGNPDAERMGYVACEYIAMQKMFEGLRDRTASETERAAAKQTALTMIAAAMDDGSQLAAASQALDAARALLPDDPELIAAGEQLAQRRGVIARGAAVRKEQAKQASLAERVEAAQREMERGNFTKAVAQWEAVLAADPSRASPQYYQAEEGIRAAKDRMKAESKKTYAAGLAAYKDGDLLSARAQLGQTVRVDPYNEAAAGKLAEVRRRLKEQASETYKEARVLEDINQVDKALGLYQKVLTYVDDPGDPLASKAQARINALLQ